jgi:hypothetical protein
LARVLQNHLRQFCQSFLNFSDMKKVTLNTSGATASDLVVKASTIVSKMTGNANFPTPSPALNSITTEITLLSAKLAEQQTAFRNHQQKTAEVHAQRKKVLELLQTEATYVQLTSGGDELKILSAGFDVREKATPLGLLPAPTKVLAEAGGSDGEIMVSFGRVYGAKSYVIEVSYDISSADNWDIFGIVTRTRSTLRGLESGKRIWVRVAAVSAAGNGAYSDPATKTIP